MVYCSANGFLYITDRLVDEACAIGGEHRLPSRRTPCITRSLRLGFCHAWISCGQVSYPREFLRFKVLSEARYLVPVGLADGVLLTDRHFPLRFTRGILLSSLILTHALSLTLSRASITMQSGPPSISKPAIITQHNVSNCP
jgi:hypothetical protein